MMFCCLWLMSGRYVKISGYSSKLKMYYKETSSLSKTVNIHIYQEDPILHSQCCFRLCTHQGSSWVWVRRTATTGTWESTSARRTGTTRCRCDTAVRTCLVETIDIDRRRKLVRSVLYSCQIRSPYLRRRYKYKQQLRITWSWLTRIVRDNASMTSIRQNRRAHLPIRYTR